MNIIMPLVVSLPNLVAVAALGRALWQIVTPGTVITLSGDLGTGKTAIARAVIRTAVGMYEEVPSPTFTLVQIYDTSSDRIIWHFDLYRLISPDEALELGIEEAFAAGVSLVEWPERLGSSLQPADRLEITLLLTGRKKERLAYLRAYGWWVKHMSQVKRIIKKEQS